MKKEQHRIKLHCDVRSHKDIFKRMMDQINRTMGLQSGGHHCLLPKSLGAGDPQYPQPWFSRVPHQPPQPRTDAGPLPHTGTARWPTLGAADRAGLAGRCQLCQHFPFSGTIRCQKEIPDFNCKGNVWREEKRPEEKQPVVEWYLLSKSAFPSSTATSQARPSLSVESFKWRKRKIAYA